MCVKLDAIDWKNYTISFFAGLAASLAIIFSLENQSNLQTAVFYSYLIILYFVGILAVGIINAITFSKKRK